MINLSQFGKILEIGFTDRMSGYHHDVLSENYDGTTSIVLPDAFSYENLPCRISFSKTESPTDYNQDNTPINATPKIFCKVDADILQGDYVIVERLDESGNVLATYRGIIGLPNVYLTHKEVLLDVEESA